MEKATDLIGKNLLIYNPKGGMKYSANEIGTYLKRFSLHEALRLIGEISYTIRNKSSWTNVRGIPISDSILAYIAMRLIENSNDYRSGKMTIDDLSKACDMYFGLPDPIENNLDAQACLIRLGSVQFDYDREERNLLPRTLLIYRDLWSRFAQSSKVDIESALRNISGLSLGEILIFALAFTGASKRGFFRIYEDRQRTTPRLRTLFAREKQIAFVNWIACGYSEFREKAKLPNIPSRFHEKFRFNPMAKKPLIIPDRNPKPGLPQVYIVPIHRLLFERVTRGLYFELSEFFMEDGKRNVFRTSFGYVFQEYVGNLLKNCIRNADVLSEWKYAKSQRDTSDWIVLQNKQAIFVEVKQSCLYLKAKNWADIKDVRRDLTQTIASGVKQLLSFEKDVQSRKYPELGKLANTLEIERLIVTHDRSYYVNSILRDMVKKILVEQNHIVPEDYHWHTISVEELEYALGIHGTSFFDFLKLKRLEPSSDMMDFRDYLAITSPESEFSNSYLDKISDNFFSEFDLGKLGKSEKRDGMGLPLIID